MEQIIYSSAIDSVPK